jgi:hypothetical protein
MLCLCEVRLRMRPDSAYGSSTPPLPLRRHLHRACFQKSFKHCRESHSPCVSLNEYLERARAAAYLQRSRVPGPVQKLYVLEPPVKDADGAVHLAVASRSRQKIVGGAQASNRMSRKASDYRDIRVRRFLARVNQVLFCLPDYCVVEDRANLAHRHACPEADPHQGTRNAPKCS